MPPSFHPEIPADCSPSLGQRISRCASFALAAGCARTAATEARIRAIPRGALHETSLPLGFAALILAYAMVVLWLDLPPNMHTTVPRRGYLLNMYVEPTHRRRGLARVLVDEALFVCRASGVDAVSLHASDAGRPLYEALGFTSTNEMRITLP